jgi:hypothetical protein
MEQLKMIFFICSKKIDMLLHLGNVGLLRHTGDKAGVNYLTVTI